MDFFGARLISGPGKGARLAVFCAFEVADSFRWVPFADSALSVAEDSFAAFLGVALVFESAGASPVASMVPAAAASEAVLMSEGAFLRAAGVFFPGDFPSVGALGALLEELGEAARFLAAGFGAAVGGRLAPVLSAAASRLVLADFFAEGFFATAFLAEVVAALPPFPDSLAIGALVDACG